MSRSQVTRAAGAAALRRDRVVARIAIGITGGAILLAVVVAIRLEAGRVTPSPSDAGVLAVLPFRSTEPDPATSYFGIGLADAILNRVSRVPGLTVRPMSATLALAAELTDPMAAGRALGASAVLAGTYHLTTRRIDIQVTLIDVGTGAVLWRHSLDSAMTDLMQVEQQVVRQTLDVLMPDPMSEPAPAAPVGGERDPAAHYLYILARGKMATLLVEVIP
ncbi:MAG TPA: hypothetical protein VFP98_02785, partial [Candidatus Polarisedimenticolia bacterium]|nr:hypothetical protein [Candidatus Polarisedimenticolia bacterium]